MRPVSHHIQTSRNGKILWILPTPAYILTKRDPFLILWSFLGIVSIGLFSFVLALFWDYLAVWFFDTLLHITIIIESYAQLSTLIFMIFLSTIYISGGRIKMSRADVILTSKRLYLRKFKPVWLILYKKILWQDIEFISYENMSYEETSEITIKTKKKTYNYRFAHIPEAEKNIIINWLHTYTPEEKWKKMPEQVKDDRKVG